MIIASLCRPTFAMFDIERDEGGSQISFSIGVQWVAHAAEIGIILERRR